MVMRMEASRFKVMFVICWKESVLAGWGWLVVTRNATWNLEKLGGMVSIPLPSVTLWKHLAEISGSQTFFLQFVLSDIPLLFE